MRRPSRGRYQAITALAVVAVALALAIGGGPSPTRAADPSPPTSSSWWHVDTDGQPVVDLWFGWSSTCPHCTKARAWLADLVPRAPWLEVHSRQVDGTDGPANVEELSALATTIDEELSAVPIFMFAGRLEVGFDEAATTGTQLERALTDYHDSLHAATTTTTAPSASMGATAPPPSATPADGSTAITLPFVGPVDAATLSLPLLAVTLGGLDAVNPCALSVLLFLVSALVGANARRRILLVGGAFVATTAVVYFLLMAAWLNAFLWFGELRAVTLVAGAAAVVVGLINIKDFGWFRRGPSLVIPEAARPAIFGRILEVSESVALPALVGTAILVATTAAVYEMLCTGGFPVVFTRVLTLSDLPTPAYYGYLGLYVAVYVGPMLAIVGAVALTLGTRSVTVDQARRLKLLSGLLMVGVGSLLLFAPAQLSDLSWTLALFGGAALAWLVLVTVDRDRRGGRRDRPPRHGGPRPTSPLTR